MGSLTTTVCVNCEQTVLLSAVDERGWCPSCVFSSNAASAPSADDPDSERAARVRGALAKAAERKSETPRPAPPKVELPPAVRKAAAEAKREAQEEAEQTAVAKARQELAARELARRRLLPYTLRFNSGYLAGWLHKLICKELEEFSKAVAEGKSPRLILQVPPRHGKTQLASIELPSWHLGHYPEHEIICASHTASLAERNSRAVRNRLMDPDYHRLFSTRLARDSKSVSQWNTTAGGGLKAVGVGGAVVGAGAHILLIDDPISGIAQAESPSELAKILEWYQTEAYTRLAPGGGVCIIMQRWNENDLAGALISQAERDPTADQFKVIHFPAIAEHDEPYRKKGEALHPERFSLEQLLRIKAALTPRQWSTLYQQNPIPDEGNYFTRDMFRTYRADELPVALRVVACWDLAIGKATNNDYSVGVVAGLAPSGCIYVMDVRRGRWDAYELVDQMLAQQAQFGVEVLGIEKGQIEMTLMPLLQKVRAERGQWDFAIERLRVGKQDKIARARAIQGRMQQGMVLFDEQAPWFPSLQSEMLRFPDGKHDDQVDAIAHVGQLLVDMPPPSVPKQEQKKSWRDRLLDMARGAERVTDMSA